jgi:hypothetical protein
MNTIVFVLVVVLSHGYNAPTLEFSTMAKCEAAIGAFKNEFPPGLGIPSFRARCVKIEK